MQDGIKVESENFKLLRANGVFYLYNIREDTTTFIGSDSREALEYFMSVMIAQLDI